MKYQTMTSLLFMLLHLSLINCQEDNLPNPEPEDQYEPTICDKLYPPLDTVITSHTNFTRLNYPKRIKKFMEDTIVSGDIVMLGNSLTEQGGNWEVRLDQPEVKNRGIAGDNADGALARLNEILCHEPSIVFVMVGTNDLWTSYTVEEVGLKIDEIGTTLATSLPESTVYIQTLMPLGAGHDKTQRLKAINKEINGLTDKTYRVIDTYSAMSNDDGVLAEDFTTDGVHLTSAGYAQWVTFLKEFINI